MRYCVVTSEAIVMRQPNGKLTWAVGRGRLDRGLWFETQLEAHQAWYAAPKRNLPTKILEISGDAPVGKLVYVVYAGDYYVVEDKQHNLKLKYRKSVVGADAVRFATVTAVQHAIRELKDRNPNGKNLLASMCVRI
jgi:hypothetical protein